MTTQLTSGPEIDTDFFEELGEVFARHPDAARRYVVHATDLEVEGLEVDFDRQYAVARIEEDRIVTEFWDSEALTSRGGAACCQWRYVDGRWECVQECWM